MSARPHEAPSTAIAGDDPVAMAIAARLRHVSDDHPGITRHKARHGFDYRDHGALIGDFATLQRIKALAIPPAWADVWICPSANGHIQATGRDARRRKQYRYHPRWRETRDETKYGRMLVFSRALPQIRARVDVDLRRHGLPRERVLAAIVRLMELTLFRIGNVEYSKANKSYGADHVARPACGDRRKRDPPQLFAARAGCGTRAGSPTAGSRASSRTVETCPATSCSNMSITMATGTPSTSNDVNEYLREISGEDITAKDFRTWAGTQLAAMALQQLSALDSAAATKSTIVRAVEQVAKHLGNTVAVCRKCYIHPAIFEGYLDGTLLRTLAERTRDYLTENIEGMSAEEAAVTAFLRLRLSNLAHESNQPQRRARAG